MTRFFTAFLMLATQVALLSVAHAQPDRKQVYVHAVTRGAGLMPWQEPGLSEAERNFRSMIEARKDALLANAKPAHPAFYDADAIALARENVASHAWARDWLAGQVARAEEMAAQSDAWIANMIPREAPAHGYGFTCPNCVGKKSQEATGYELVDWNYKSPDTFSCRECGMEYPNAEYAENIILQLPRTGHQVPYYLNAEEQANPNDRSGKLAWHWVGYPTHNSYTGIIRERKIGFMSNAVRSLGLAYLFTGEPRYAETARRILVRFAECYRQWPYRDYWDTYADCDPLYAAWHDTSLPLEWKRHLSEQAFAKDTPEAARMLQNYWGAGRFHASTDGVSITSDFVLAYDFTCDALNADGTPVWDEASRRLVERDLLLEWIMGAEPYVGGPGKAEEKNNKAPRVYQAMAVLGKCLGIPEYADVALRGYERVRDASFLYDGFSTESPSYTNMYLAQLLVVPEALHGYTWPEGFSGRSGTVDLYAQDPQLRMMYRSVLDTLQPDGTYLLLSDTRLNSKPSPHILQMGARHYPEIYGGVLPSIHKNSVGEYAIFSLTDTQLHEERPLALNEIYYPAWKTAILRHGTDRDADTLTFAFNPQGGHRHRDNLALFYADGNQTLVGDHGYLGDMPVNEWIRSTRSHGLVVVDDEDQAFSARTTEFSFMVTSPLASVVEANSTAYPQCSEYRRRVMLVKEGAHDSFVVDLFSVKGGREHRYRVYSEIASSDAADGHLTFHGVSLPPEAPLPQFGASLAEEHIYGLRDVRSGAPDSSTWNVTWQEATAAYRLWMTSACDAVEASNGPGQRTHSEAGRRVRYVDAVRRGDDGLESLYVAVHEGASAGDAFLVRSVTHWPAEAGPAAVALTVATASGSYIVLNDFDTPATVGDIRFQGQFALVYLPNEGPAQVLSVSAGLLEVQGRSITSGTPVWRGPATTTSDTTFQAGSEAPADWHFSPGPARTYARVLQDGDWTAFPIDSVDGKQVTVRRFPAQPVSEMEIPSVVFVADASE